MEILKKAKTTLWALFKNWFKKMRFFCGACSPLNFSYISAKGYILVILAAQLFYW